MHNMYNIYILYYKFIEIVFSKKKMYTKNFFLFTLPFVFGLFYTVSAIDITIHDVQFYGMKLAGIILISIGFLLVMFPNNWPEYIFRLLR